MLQPGVMAPDFEIPVLIGGVKKQFRLSEHRNRQNLVLAFYPVNWEPVSAQQILRIRWSGRNSSSARLK